MRIFNGLTSERSDKSTVKAPGNADYWALVHEIAETQKFVIDLSQNLKVMPDLDGMLQAAKDKIEELQSQLEKLVIPETVMNRLEELERSHLEIDSRAQVASLAHKNEQTKGELLKNQVQVAKMQEAFAIEVRSFQNKIWGALEEFKDATQKRLDSLEAKVDMLSTGVELNALLAKLKG